MNSNFLKNFFEWNREVIESAETPFARFASFILPIIAPLVPAFLTSVRLHSLFLNLMGNSLPDQIALIGSFTTATVLELLGYVGTIAFVRFIFRWVKTKEIEFFIPMILTMIAYFFYLWAMYSINVQLNSETPNTNNVFALLSFMTVPAGLIFAVNVNDNQEKREDFTIRQEKREDKLKKEALKRGINVFEIGNNSSKRLDGKENLPQEKPKEKPASFYKGEIIKMLNNTYTRTGRVLRVVEIVKELKLDYNNSKGFISSQRKIWIEQNGIAENVSQ